MKKIFSFAMAAALAIGLASCTKEVDNGNGNGTGPDGDAMVTFTVKTQKGSFVTYADIATPAEWAVNSVDVYAFAGGNLVGTGKLTESDDYEVSKSGNTTTIRVNSAWLSPLSGQTVNFYFVGNDDGHVPASVPTTEVAFKALVTKELALDVNDHAALITTPLLFSATQSVTLDRRLEIPVQLKRREARFDIVNKYDPATQLVINKITALNTNIAGYMFSTGSGVTFTQKHSQAITVPTGAAWVKSQEGTPARDIWTAGSVFYLYPTKLGKEANGETELIINATMGTGQPTDYTLAAGSQINIIANNRYKIILDPLSLTFIVAPVDWEEGGNLETVTGGDDTFSGFTASADAGIAANWNAATNVYKFDDNATGNLSVVVNSTYGSSYKVTYSMGDETNVTFADPNVNTVRTYAGQTTVDTYTIAVPTLKSVDTKAYSIRLEIFSPGGEAKKAIVFARGTLDENYIKDNVADEKLGEAIEEIIKGNAGKGDGDAITPEDIENTTELDLSSKTDITSIEGLDELFPNLKQLKVNGNVGITEVDASKFPSLELLYVHGCINVERLVLDNPALKTLAIHNLAKITSIDLSKIPNLRTLGMENTVIPSSSLDFSVLNDFISLTIGNNPNITSIDLSMHNNLEYVLIKTCPNLVSINTGNQTTKLTYYSIMANSLLQSLNLPINRNEGVTTLTVQNNPKLTSSIDASVFPNAKDLYLNKNAELTQVDISKNTKVEQLYINETKVGQLDISHLKNTIQRLTFSDVSSPFTLFVWSDFNTTTPSASIPNYYAGTTAVTFTQK